MPRVCTVCCHGDHHKIDKELVANLPQRQVARRYGISPDSIKRHLASGHVVRTISKAAEAKEILQGVDLVAKLHELAVDAQQILEESRNVKQYSAAMAAIREMARIVELVARLTGQLDESTRVNILVQQQAAAAAEQDLMLDRLTVPELAELRRLVAKAQGEPSAPGNGVSVPAKGILMGGGGNGAES
jgi:hypothetical protein